MQHHSWVGMHSVLFLLRAVARGQGKKEHKSTFQAWAPGCTYWAFWNTSNLILEDPGSGRTYRHSRAMLTSWTVCSLHPQSRAPTAAVCRHQLLVGEGHSFQTAPP